MASSSTESGLQLEAVSPAPPVSHVTGSGETLNMEVMSPAAMAYLLEVISADMNKVEEFNRLRRNSGAVGFVLQGNTGGKKVQDHEAPVSLSTSHALTKSVTTAVPSVSTQSTDPCPLPSVETILTTTATPTLTDVTNHEPRQQLSNDEHEHDVIKTPASPLKRTSSQRKRSIDEDDVDDAVVCQRSNKRSRSSTTSSEGNGDSWEYIIMCCTELSCVKFF